MLNFIGNADFKKNYYDYYCWKSVLEREDTVHFTAEQRFMAAINMVRSYKLLLEKVHEFATLREQSDSDALEWLAFYREQIGVNIRNIQEKSTMLNLSVDQGREVEFEISGLNQANEQIKKLFPRSAEFENCFSEYMRFYNQTLSSEAPRAYLAHLRKAINKLEEYWRLCQEKSVHENMWILVENRSLTHELLMQHYTILQGKITNAITIKAEQNGGSKDTAEIQALSQLSDQFKNAWGQYCDFIKKFTELDEALEESLNTVIEEESQIRADEALKLLGQDLEIVKRLIESKKQRFLSGHRSGDDKNSASSRFSTSQETRLILKLPNPSDHRAQLEEEWEKFITEQMNLGGQTSEEVTNLLITNFSRTVSGLTTLFRRDANNGIFGASINLFSNMLLITAPEVASHIFSSPEAGAFFVPTSVQALTTLSEIGEQEEKSSLLRKRTEEFSEELTEKFEKVTRHAQNDLKKQHEVITSQVFKKIDADNKRAGAINKTVLDTTPESIYHRSEFTSMVLGGPGASLFSHSAAHIMEQVFPTSIPSSPRSPRFT